MEDRSHGGLLLIVKCEPNVHHPPDSIQSFYIIKNNNIMVRVTHDPLRTTIVIPISE